MTDQPNAPAPAEARGTCATCKHFDRFPIDVNEGLCRRYPPTFVPGLRESFWPQVESNCHCGEHAPAEGTR